MFNILLHTRLQNMPIGSAKRTNNETKTKQRNPNLQAEMGTFRPYYLCN